MRSGKLYWDVLTALVVWLIIGIIFSAWAQEVKPNFAVIGLKNADGVSAGEADIIADRLRIELFSTGLINMMERNQMQQILEEQGFQQSGACTDEECMVEIGQMLGVEVLISGSIGKLGTMFLLNFRSIDVQTAEIINVVSVDITGGIEAVVKHLPNIARELVGKAGTEPQVATTSGDLYIDSDKPASSIKIDGNTVAGKTPITLKGLPAGEHNIVVQKGAWHGSKTVVITPNELCKVTIKMQRGGGSLELFTKPAGAQVYIGDKKYGPTPIRIDGLVAGEHIVRFVKHGCIEKKNKITVITGETQTLSVLLEEIAYVTVKTDVKSASIFINGKSAGTGNVELYKVPPGNSNVKIEASGYHVIETTINLAAGDKKVIDEKLVSIFGSLHVTSIPEGALVFLNTKLEGSTPYTNKKLMPGNYMLKLQMKGCKDIKEDISIVENKKVTREYKLEYTKAYLDSVAKAKKVQKKMRRNIRRVVFGILAAGSGGAALIFNKIANDKIDDYNAIAERYDVAASQFNGYKDDYKKVRDKADLFMLFRNVSIGVAGAWTVCFGISIPF